MKRWALVAAVLSALVLASLPHSGHAQGKDTLVVALVAHAPTLDPHMHFERVGILVNVNMFDSLLHRNTKLEFEPSLATSWKAVSDTQWEFKIRKGVRFHNGDIMTAEDVKYSFDRVLDPKKKSPQYGNIRAIKDVRVVDPETIVITTDKPFPLLLERLTFFCIVPKKHVEAVGDQAFGTTAAVGTGPWKFVEWKRDQLIRLEAFDQHWRGKPPFRQLIFRAIPEVATQVAEIKTGGVDIIRNVSADLVPELKTNPQTYVSSTPILRVHSVELDMRVAPFDKKAVRQAANYAIDKQTVVQKLMASLGRPVATTVQPQAFGYDPEVKAYPSDPKKAKELLTQAGYANGVDVTLHSAAVEFRPVFEASARCSPRWASAPRPRCGIPDRPGTSSSRARARLRTAFTSRGATTPCSTLTRCSTPSITRRRVAGSGSGTRGWTASTVPSTRRAPPSTRPGASGSTARSSRRSARKRPASSCGRSTTPSPSPSGWSTRRVRMSGCGSSTPSRSASEAYRPRLTALPC